MKKTMLLTMALAFCATMGAKDVKTLVVTTTPQMHCANCENKIKGNLRFEKGVKDIATDIPSQTVTVTYDAEKTSVASLTQAFSKIGYSIQQKEVKASTKDKANTKAEKAKTKAEKAKTKADKGKTTKDTKQKTQKVKRPRTDGSTGASQQMH